MYSAPPNCGCAYRAQVSETAAAVTPNTLPQSSFFGGLDEPDNADYTHYFLSQPPPTNSTTNPPPAVGGLGKVIIRQKEKKQEVVVPVKNGGALSNKIRPK